MRNPEVDREILQHMHEQVQQGIYTIPHEIESMFRAYFQSHDWEESTPVYLNNIVSMVFQIKDVFSLLEKHRDYLFSNDFEETEEDGEAIQLGQAS